MEHWFRGDKFSKKLKLAMNTIPREKFVSRKLFDKAQDNTPLPIGLGQTISQPYIVAFMSDTLNIIPGSKVLEVGTGSGYQTAILAALDADVYTIEILPALHKRAKKCFCDLGLTTIKMRVSNGYFGWETEAPFDKIIVTAAARSIPLPLISQLKRGGRMIIPIGPKHHAQCLTVVDKGIDNKIKKRSVLPVRFVPLINEQ